MSIDYRKSAPAPPAAAGPLANPGRVTLTKSAPTVSLSKQTGRLHVNLNWEARPPAAKGGLLKRLAGPPKGIDLDLGCLYELTDGSKGVVQALGNAFGRLDAPPYISLSGDDRSGESSGGEDLFVNLARAGEIRRVLVFASIYDGVPSFEEAHGVVTLTPGSGPSIEVRLDEQAGRSRMCAIALLEGGGTDLTVRREVRYLDGGQAALDQAYGWGMTWTAGRK